MFGLFERAKEPTEKPKIFCSFCGKLQHEVLKLIAGPSVFICDRCTDMCIEVILDKNVELNNMPNLRSLVQQAQNKES